MTELSAPHDRFFKALMDQPASAGALLRERLPAAIVARLADTPPEPVAGSFVDPALAEHHSDRLFRARLRDGGTALIYVLVEHKSAVDRRIGLQLLRYLVRIWERVDREAGGRGPLPPIVPLVVYHGVERWEGPGRFVDLVAAEATMVPHLLDFPFDIVDLGRIPDAELSHEARLRMGLALLKHVFLGTDPRGLLDEEGTAALRADRAFFDTLMRYILAGMGPMDRPVILDLVARVLPGEEEAVLSKFAEEWMNKGRAEGEAKGEAKALLRLLERRFGTIPASRHAQIMEASTEQLDAWLDATLDADSLEAVFGAPIAH